MLEGIAAGLALGQAGNDAAAAARAKGDVQVAQSIADRAMHDAERANQMSSAMLQTMQKTAESFAQLNADHEASCTAILHFQEIIVGNKADDSGLRALTDALLDGLRQAEPGHALLDRKARSRLFGEAAFDFQETHPGMTFVQVAALAAGRCAVIRELDAALKLANPGHVLCDPDEQIITYWQAFHLDYQRQIRRSPTVDHLIELTKDDDYLREVVLKNPIYMQATPKLRKIAVDRVTPKEPVPLATWLAMTDEGRENCLKQGLLAPELPPAPKPPLAVEVWQAMTAEERMDALISGESPPVGCPG